MNKAQLTEMIAHRDGITYNEAENAIEDCVRNIYNYLDDEEIDYYTLYELVADEIRDSLGLEPDYIDILLG